MSHVVVIGCGVIGASIAYELSQVSGLKITVIDQKSPAQAATGAALGVLMGVISHKIKGKAWQLRQSSIRRYQCLIPELEALTGQLIPCNRQGILMLLLDPTVEVFTKWEQLAQTRHSQGWELELWDGAKLEASYPQLNLDKITGAVYSPQDLQIDPTALTLALVQACRRNGVNFQFGVEVLGMETSHPVSVDTADTQELGTVHHLQTTGGKFPADYCIVAAGLGSTFLTEELQQKVDIRPVLGQALQLRLNRPVGNPDFQPVITGNDVHIVPIAGGDYWVGATVEFPQHGDEVVGDAQLLEQVLQQAIALCPDLATAEIVKTWSGLRPRPEGRPAPIIEKLPGYSNILLATGHYRNGVLLAPATALAIREMILEFKPPMHADAR